MADRLILARDILRASDGTTALAGGTVLFVRHATMLPVSLFTDATAETNLPNPVTADSSGRLPLVWFADEFAVDAIVRTPGGALVERIENVPRWGSTDSAASGISISPIDGVQAEDVQEALEVLAGIALADADLTTEERRENLGLGTAATRNVDTDTYDFATEAGEGNIPTRRTVNLFHGANTALTKRAQSGELAIASATTVTFAHSFGAAPDFAALTLICKSAEAGYSVGDRVQVPLNCSSDSVTRLNVIELQDTYVALRYSDAAQPFAVRHRSGGTYVALTNSSWRAIVTIYG